MNPARQQKVMQWHQAHGDKPLSGRSYLPGPEVVTGWRKILDPFFQSEAGQQLLSFLQEEIRSQQVLFPPASQVYRSLEDFDVGQTRVVILGQDPYHGAGQAHGLAFSVLAGNRLPPSLKNIFKELKDDLGIDRESGDLSDWSQQGVLLLNATLTVREGQAGAHAREGWEVLTDQLIQWVNQEAPPCAFILWGKDAIAKSKWIDETKHCVLPSPHPSPLSAYRGFFGSKPFSKANTYLQQQGRSPIRW